MCYLLTTLHSFIFNMKIWPQIHNESKSFIETIFLCPVLHIDNTSEFGVPLLCSFEGLVKLPKSENLYDRLNSIVGWEFNTLLGVFDRSHNRTCDSALVSDNPGSIDLELCCGIWHTQIDVSTQWTDQSLMSHVHFFVIQEQSVQDNVELSLIFLELIQIDWMLNVGGSKILIGLRSLSLCGESRHRHSHFAGILDG